MRRNGAYALGIGIVVAELLVFGRLLAFDDLAGHDALFPEAGTQLREQFGGFRKALDENVACAFERRFRIRNVNGLRAISGSFYIYVLHRFLLWIERRIGEERVSQRFQPSLPRTLC